MSDDIVTFLKLCVFALVLGAVYVRARSLKARARRIRAFGGPAFNRLVIRIGVDFGDRAPIEPVVTEATALANEHRFNWTEKPFANALVARLESLEKSGTFDGYRRAQESARVDAKANLSKQEAFATLHDSDPSSAVADGAVHLIDLTADSPMPWGRYKGSWYAHLCDDTENTLRHLGASVIKRANWKSGTAISWLKDSPWTFVPPAINGWVVVVGEEFIPTFHEASMDRWRAQFAALSKHFGEVQFFASHRVSGSVQHAKAVNGEIVRIFDRQDGHVKEWGAPTDTEIAAGYDRWQANKDEQHHMWSPGDPAGAWYGGEELPFLIADEWTVDPGKYDKMGLPSSVGYLVKL